ncbi:hypothetical protein Gotri_006931 [Gossypium trilobum]|uniref:Uncharacterized protein n=1 Tax=Gossypium trilobum TaxID=34281 RepID=A0A7J9FW57_9ROSI|nr:hypothetical protein [Gossypium trilobum]
MTTPEYYGWWSKRINDNILGPREDCVQSLEEHLQVVPSELEIIKLDFEKMSLEWGKKIEQLEEEKMRLGLDVDIHRLEAEKLRKGKKKAEEDLDSLKIDYKKLRLSMRTAGLGKTSEQWRREIKEERTKADKWEKEFQDARARESISEKSLLECQNEKEGLKARVAKLEKSLHLYRNRKSAIELRASLKKIDELNERIEELEEAWKNSELRVELLERSNEQWREQFHHSQNQIRERDYIMGEAVTQVREVADHLQTLAVQADVLSLNYESESSRGRDLAWLLRKVKALSVKAKPTTLETNKNSPTVYHYGTRRKKKAMDQRFERLEQLQKEMKEQMQERLEKIQQDMRNETIESQKSMMAELTQLLKGGNDKGKDPMVNTEEENNDSPLYPPGFTPPHARTQAEVHPRRSSVTIRPQQFQTGASRPVNFQTGIGSHLGEAPTNSIVPDFDEMMGKEKTKEELPSRLEERCKWLEEKFKAMESSENYHGIDAKYLSLVPDLVLPYKFKMPEFENYNETSCPEAHITMFCRRMTGHINNDQLLIHCFQDRLAGAASRWYNQLSRAKIGSWRDLAQAFIKQYNHVADMVPDRITL